MEQLTEHQKQLLLDMVPRGWYTAHTLDPEATGYDGASSEWVREALRQLRDRGILESQERRVNKPNIRTGSFSKEKGAPKYRLTPRGEEVWRSLTGARKEA